MKLENNHACLASGKHVDLPMIYIEGNVGVGKSTFLHILEQHLETHVFYEPNELWQDVGGYNLLENFFLDQNRWAYSLQSYVLTTRIDQMLEADTSLCNKVCLVERSPYSGRYVFAKVAKEIGTMNGLEWCLYQKLWDREIKRCLRPVGGFIYLRSSVDVCYNRIVNRGRMEEKPVTFDYLRRLEEKHDNWFIKKQGVDEALAYAPVLILDFSLDLQKDHELLQKYVAEVKNFISKIQSQGAT